MPLVDVPVTYWPKNQAFSKIRKIALPGVLFNEATNYILVDQMEHFFLAQISIAARTKDSSILKIWANRTEG